MKALADWVQSWLGAPYLAAAVAVMLLYVVQAEVRFGAKARASSAGAADRGSTIALSNAILAPIFGLVLAINATRSHASGWLAFFGPASPVALPLMPALAWIGVAIAALGLPLRLWAVLVLRERYTRTLLIQEGHVIERTGPYRIVRHPGYLGSLMTLNGIALASGNAVVFLASLVFTLAAYAHRIRAEDAMLVEAFGEPYATYRREVKALVPFVW